MKEEHMRDTSRARWCAGILMGTMALLAAACAAAAPALRVVVSLPAGGGVDAMARIVAQGLAKRCDCSVVVENKPGASGTIAARAVINSSSSEPSILASGNQEITIAPFLIKDPHYRPMHDLQPLLQVGTVASVLFAKAGGEWASSAAFLRSLHRSPAIGIGVPGVGTPMHLALSAVAGEAGGAFLAVPYKGAPGVVMAVLSQSVAYGTAGLPAVSSLIANGGVRALAVLGSQSSSLLPGVPAITSYVPLREKIPEISYGFFAPSSWPQARRRQLEADLKAVVQDPDIRKKLERLGIEKPVMGAAAYEAELKSQLEYYGHAMARLAKTESGHGHQ